MKKLLFLILPFLIFSCSNEMNEPVQIPEGDFEVYNFEYNGEKYSVKYRYAADSAVIFENPAMKEFIEKIDEEPELATFVNADESLSFFSDFNTLAEAKGINTVETRSNSVEPFEIILYDKDNYGGSSMTIDVVPPIVVIPWWSDFSSVGFDDKTSSAKIRNYSKGRYLHVTFYQKVKWSGKTLTFKVDPANPFIHQNWVDLWIPKFSKYTLKSGVLGIGKKTWDNKVSSVSIRN